MLDGIANKERPLFGSIEAGGTKFICAVGYDAHTIVDEILFPTTTPLETMSKVMEFFHNSSEKIQELSAIGVGSFGPVNINRDSDTFGQILQTPKKGWSDFNIIQTLKSSFPVPIALDTDVNCALLAEVNWGAGRGLNNVAYMTVGTGIGGGFYINGNVANGFIHPEIGHLRIESQLEGDDFEGVCPYHKNKCFEGLASGPALIKRWGKKPHELPIDHEAWTLEADYLARLCLNVVLTTSPERIIMGGGVMKQTQLFGMIKERLKHMLNGYMNFDRHNVDFENYIVPQGLGGQAGVMGGLELARHIASSTN